MGFLFIISAALQYNDPDPYIWMLLYLYAAFLCFRAVGMMFNKTAYLLGIGVYSVYAVLLFFDRSGVLFWASEHHAESIVQSMKAAKPWIEETREFFGLLIMIVVLRVNAIYFRRKAADKS